MLLSAALILAAHAASVVGPAPVKPLDFEAEKLLLEVSRFYGSETSLKISGRSFTEGQESDASSFDFFYSAPDKTRYEVPAGSGGAKHTAVRNGRETAYTDSRATSGRSRVPGLEAIRSRPFYGPHEKIDAITKGRVGARECDVIEIGNFEYQRTMRRMFIDSEGAVRRVEHLQPEGGALVFEAIEIVKGFDVAKDAFVAPEGASKFTAPHPNEDNRWKAVAQPIGPGATATDFTVTNVRDNSKVTLGDLIAGKRLLVLNFFCLH
jgi:hypothetical protein